MQAAVRRGAEDGEGDGGEGKQEQAADVAAAFGCLGTVGAGGMRHPDIVAGACGRQIARYCWMGWL